MGWYQDNFPGSPAAKQRALLSRGLIVYSLVTGTAIFFFAPFCRRIRKDFEEGRVLDDWSWLQGRSDIKKSSNNNWFSTRPSREELLSVEQNKAKEARGDFVGPDVSEETLRSFQGTRA